MELHSRSMSSLRPVDMEPLPPPRRAGSYPAEDLSVTVPFRGGASKRNKEKPSSSRMDDGVPGNWLKRYTTIDIQGTPDEATPGGAIDEFFAYDHIDFSAVFGTDLPDERKYAETKGYEEFEDDFNRNGNKDEAKKSKPRAPEYLINLFALRLALIEKTASGLGTLAFLFATVVILGGFATTIDLTDFWVVTVIIFAEGSRIFSRSHELEWRQMSTKSSGSLLTIHGIFNAARSLSRVSTGSDKDHTSTHNSKSLMQRARSRFSPFSPNRTSRSRKKSPNLSPESPDSDTTTNSTSSNSRHTRYPGPVGVAAAVPARAPGPVKNTVASLPVTPLLPQILPLVNKVVSTEVVHWILYIVQLVSATMCIGLSLWRLSTQSYYKYKPNSSDSEKMPNVTISMNLFYVISVLEAGLFLLERGYWEYNYRFVGLLNNVREDADLGDDNKEIVKQFFYDVYAGCLNGSIFDGLSTDLVAYSISWLQTEDPLQQLSGARLLNRIVSKKTRFASAALRQLGTTPGVIERLVEMLSWKDEKDLLGHIANIICRLVIYNRNCSRFVAVPGSTDAVVALLYPHARHSIDNWQAEHNRTIALRLAGLRILKYLCIDHKNCLAIGETRSLLPLLMMFIEVRSTSPLKSEKFTRPENLKDHLKTYKKSLQVLRLLARATNNSGRELRKRIAAIVSGLTNMRDVIEFGKKKPELQLLSIDILYHLAMEESVRESIGATGGLIRNLFHLFKQSGSIRESSPSVRGSSPFAANDVRESDPSRKTQDSAVPRGNEGESEAKRTASKEKVKAEKSSTERNVTEEKIMKEKKIWREQKEVSEMAGMVLTRLVLRNDKNCTRLLNVRDVSCTAKENKVLQVLINSLKQPEEIGSSAAKILRSVLNYADDNTRAVIATGCEPMMVEVIFRHSIPPKSEMYEASLGLASRALEALDRAKYMQILNTENKLDFVKQLMKNLQHTPTTNKYPRIRRYSLELLLALIDKDPTILDSFDRHKIDLKGVLTKTSDSIAEVENFCLFSGLVGYTRDRKEMEVLVEDCITAVENYHAKKSTFSQTAV